MAYNRFCICIFWEKDGIVRDYVTYYLKGLQEVANKILVVVNGEITAESREKLQALDVDVFQRENRGLDFGGWKEAIAKIGYDELSKYDELILTNTTCYGPIYPLSEMFDEMESRDCDFWGITKHPEINEYLIKGDLNSRIIEHIQSYFTVYNKKVFLSKAFKDFWRNVQLYNDYNKIVGYYETKLTKYLEDANFKSDSFIDLALHKNYVSNPKHCTDILLSQKRIPLIKRKAIVEAYQVKFGLTLPHHSLKILKYLKDNTNYDLNMVYDDLISTHPMSLIKANLHLNYVLPSNCSYSISGNTSKVALILYIYYEDLVEYCFNYAKSMPKGTDIYIVSSQESTLNECKNKAYILDGHNLIYRLKNNRGRDVSAYLVTCADVFKNYDLICCMHDKKTPQASGIKGADFQYQGFECNLKSTEYVNNVINLFESNPRLGLLSPPAPNFAGFKALNNPIGVNTKGLKELYDLLKLSIPFDKNPVAPFGAMFWIRGKAIEPLFRHNWRYESFPEEPLPQDGTVSHAIERIYPYVAQEAGYLSGWVMPEDFASIYMDNLLCSRISVSKPLSREMKSNSFWEQIFSLKNTYSKSHKVITILGAKIKIKRKVQNKNRYNKFSFFGLKPLVERKLGQLIYKDCIKKNSNARILIYLHLFYSTSWKTISEYLKNLEPYNYDLIVTCTEGFYDNKLLDEVKKFRPNAKVSVYPNFGFDVGPFIDVLQDVDLDKYDIIYKLHSKGVNRQFIFIYNQIFKYEDWFFNLFNGCLGPFSIHKAIDKIYNSTDVGIVAAKNLIINDPKHKQAFTGEFAKKYGVNINKEYHYVAGTCFAMKASLLKPIKDLNMTIDNFSITKRGVFSLAHAMERLVCACIEPQGYKFEGIDVPHNKYSFEKHKYMKYSPMRLLDDTRFDIDYDFFYKVLEMRPIREYEIVNLKLKDIKRKYHNTILELSQCHPYKYLQGEKAQYQDYCISNQKESAFAMSEERFNNLKCSIDSNNFDTRSMPVVDASNVIFDGQHRCCILLDKYGEDYEIPVLRLTFNTVPKLSFWEKCFSITNTKDRAYKVITILGITMSFRKKK